MLPKKQRVPKDLFPTPNTPKQSVSGPFFSISYTKMERSARVSVVVSKKVSNSAVIRNTVRRRVYEAIQPCLTPKSSGIVIIYAKKPVISVKFNDLTKELASLLSKTSFAFDKSALA